MQADRVCSAEGCTRAARTKGLCNNHYQQSRRAQNPAPERTVTPKLPCTVEGCDKPRHGAEYCQAHYRKAKRNGDPLIEGKRGPKPGRKWAEGEREARAEARAEGVKYERVLPLPEMCANGHPLTKDNTYITPRSGYVCLLCRSLAALKHKYGLTESQIQELSESQNHECAICHTGFDTAHPHIDHDHRCCPGERTCGKCVRGLLCQKCNLLLGNSRDDISVLQAAIRYLVDHDTDSE